MLKSINSQDLYNDYVEICRSTKNNLFMEKSKDGETFIIVKFNHHQGLNDFYELIRIERNINSFRFNIKIIKNDLKNNKFTGKFDKRDQINGIKMDNKRIHDLLKEGKRYLNKLNSFSCIVEFESNSRTECKKYFNKLCARN